MHRFFFQTFETKKSEYTQSILSDTFRNIKKDLINGIFVVFVGTPCQVDGLNNFLRARTYENLLTIDLLCTGSCSPRLLNNHVRYLETKQRKIISTYDMRKKEYIDNKWHIMNVDIEYDDGIRENIEDKYFIGCFRQHVAFRDSCYVCKYTSTKRPADITLGDYWKESDFSQDGFRGVSVIFSNTEKGFLYLNALDDRMNLKSTTIEDVILQQPALREPITKPQFSIYNDITSIEGSIRFMKKYHKSPLKIRILVAISHMLPKFVSLVLKKVYYSIGKL